PETVTRAHGSNSSRAADYQTSDQSRDDHGTLVTENFGPLPVLMRRLARVSWIGRGIGKRPVPEHGRKRLVCSNVEPLEPTTSSVVAPGPIGRFAQRSAEGTLTRKERIKGLEMRVILI